MMFDQQLKR